jgi:valyl-tRNA synthetase
VYLHGLIRDENGQKMSKTKGNVIDPLIVMDEMGTDALRFTLLVGSTPGNDANLSLKKVEANRNFANKMWNAGRFIIGALENAPAKAEEKAEYSLADRWIWSRTSQLVADVERLFQSYQYGEAGRQIYDFFWSEFADWYIEAAKLQMNQGSDRAYYTAQRLAQVLDIALRLLHPFTPFVTEEIWGFLKQACQEHPAKFLPTNGGWEDALIIAKWPEAFEKKADDKAITDFGLIQEIIRTIRNLRSEKQVKPGQKLPARLAASAETAGLLKAEAGTIAALSWVDASKLEILASEKGIDCPEGWVPLVAGPVQIFVDLASTVDLGAERARMEKELAEITGQIERLEKLLGSDFAQKAPAALVEKERQKLEGFKESAERLKTQLG